MNFDNLKDKIDKLSYIEQNYPVGDWQWHGIDYWPILKNIIYFRDRKISSNLLKNLVRSPRKVANRVLLKIRSKFSKVPTNESVAEVYQSDFLFSGAVQHRINFSNQYLNRYFDPLMDGLENQFSVQLLEYSPMSINLALYKKDRVRSPFTDYNKIVVNTQLDLITDSILLNHIDLLASTFNLTADDLTKELTTWCKRILIWKKTWIKIIGRSKPKIVFVLCYYNEPMYGLVLAANELNIPTVDMQHGGQGALHPSYYFENFPTKGFNTLPNYFWAWENTSKNQLDGFLNRNKRHQTIMGGNPWIDFLKDHKQDVTDDLGKKKIICTLTIGLDSILPGYLVQAIKESDSSYVWYLRMHPRTSQFDKNILMKIISNEKIENKVNIEEANFLPLPYLLANAWAHISHSSGSIAEAAIMNVPRNVITDVIGFNNFQELVLNGSATYFDVNELKSLFNFLVELNPIIGQEENNITNQEKYQNIISEIMERYESGIKV